PASSSIPVTFLVGPGTGPVLSLDKQSLSFGFPRNANARAQSLAVSNTGGGALGFTVSVTTAIGNWLSVSPSTGSVFPGAPLILAVTADPAGMEPGTYTGQVVVASAGATRTVAVTMTISDLNQAILLSHSGLSFTAVQRGGVVPPQSFSILNIGVGVVSWTVSTSTLAGGPA